MTDLGLTAEEAEVELERVAALGGLPRPRFTTGGGLAETAGDLGGLPGPRLLGCFITAAVVKLGLA